MVSLCCSVCGCRYPAPSSPAYRSKRAKEIGLQLGVTAVLVALLSTAGGLLFNKR
jgi:hypothetical protein